MNDNHRKSLPISPSCFVCGEHNPAGLRSNFYVENGAVYMPLHPKTHHCSYPNVVHGGIVATALDECMAWAAARAFGRMCLTARLSVRYLDRAPLRETLLVRAEVVKTHKRIVYAQAELQDNDGKTYARAEGSFLPMSAEETLDIDKGLIYRGNEERVFEHLRAAPDAHAKA